MKKKILSNENTTLKLCQNCGQFIFSILFFNNIYYHNEDKKLEHVNNERLLKQ